MERILKIVLAVVVVALGYFLYSSIIGPIREAEYKQMVFEARVERLDKISEAQKAYKDVTDSFAGEWDELINVLRTGQYKIIKQIGDPEDTNSVVTFDTSYMSVLDSVYAGDAGVLDSLPWAPYSYDSTGARQKFDLVAAKVKNGGILIDVFQASEPKPYLDEENPLYVGSLSETTYSGSWE